MDNPSAALNQFLSKVFPDILREEERMLSRDKPDLSIREFHLIDAVCQAVDSGQGNRATDIAAAQHVTAGTLTTSVSMLERKGYLERRRDPRDRRVVRIFPTEQGRAANERHTRLRQELVDHILAALPGDEAAALARMLKKVTAFFNGALPEQA